MSNISDQNCDVHLLYAELEILKQALADKQTELLAMETTCLRETDRQAELEDSIIAWQDKYDRLYESHKRVQKVNQTLEDKLLKLVDRNSGERAQLTSDVATLSVRLAQANYNIATLQREIERYKTDINLAIQLLQCKPDSFVSQKVSSLPLEIQSKVAQYMRLDSNSHSDSEGSTTGGGGGGGSSSGNGCGITASGGIGVGVATSGAYRVLPASDSPPPLCPFPPTAMVYSMRGIDDQSSQIDSQVISPSVIVKYLEEELKSSEIKHCNTCSCTTHDLTVLAPETTSLSTYSVGTQTILQSDTENSLCLRCNSNLNSPSRANSPYIIKLVKSSDSVISETKSSMSGSNENDNEKLFTPVKKDELMVNPILGHHRLCDRTQKIIRDTTITTATTTTTTPSINSKSIDVQLDSSLNLCVKKSPATFRHHPKLNNTISKLQETDIKDLEHQQHQQQSSSGSKNNSLQNTGSMSSLWSKTSSSNHTNNTDGAKIFENFNRNLIKTMKVDFPKTAPGPRLCALRIQNGSTNILLNNIDTELSPIIYTRRTRLLDEELDETKDIIASNGQRCEQLQQQQQTTNISMVMSANTNVTVPTAGIAAATECKDDLNRPKCDYDGTVTTFSGSGGDGGCGDNSDHHRKSDIIGVMDISSSSDGNIKQMCLDKLENETMSSHKNVNNQSCTQSSSISSDVNLQESALLRREQLTRVAEWVQNNHQLDQHNHHHHHHQHSTLSSQSICSTGDVSIDSNDYKRQICNDNATNDLVVIVGPGPGASNNNDRLRNDCRMDDRTDIIVANIKDSNRIIATTFNNDKSTISATMETNAATTNANNQLMLDNRFAQQQTPNNNFLSNQQNTYNHSSHYYQQQHAHLRQQQQQQLNEIIQQNGMAENNGNTAHHQIDLAQMEYNVKQFLLKQNEWSIHNRRNRSIDTGLPSSLTTQTTNTTTNTATNLHHRTETNL